MRFEVAVIGGTGMGERLQRSSGNPVHVPTPAGTLRGRVLEAGGREVLLLSRHSAGHKVPPHRVNYTAMALGLKLAGVKACIATAATGSLREDWPDGTLVACTDFLDLTGRNATLFDREVVHTDFSTPFGPAGTQALREAASHLGMDLREGVYACGNGPRYETPHEIRLYRQFGGDVVGMTAATEAILMREAGIDYSCLAVVTNLAAGIAGHPLSHEEVVEEMERSGSRTADLIFEAIRRIQV